MTYDPNERINVLLALNTALTRVEQVGMGEERMAYDVVASRASTYLLAYDRYLSITEPVRNLRVETEPTIAEYRRE